MTDDIIQQQIAYYRARATEYDEWFYRLGRYDHGTDLNRQWFKEVEVVIGALHQFGPVGKILELAAGTGNWTQELLKIGQHVTVVDASPEMIDINRRKVKATNVEYVQADLFTWKPDTEYDMVFFGFWLSHVPPEELDAFLATVRKSVRVGGKLFLVDSSFEKTSTAKDHVLEPERGIHVTRKLNDGQEFTIVKIFYEPETLQPKLEKASFDAQVHTTENYFVYAQGVRRG